MIDDAMLSACIETDFISAVDPFLDVPSTPPAPPPTHHLIQHILSCSCSCSPPPPDAADIAARRRDGIFCTKKVSIECLPVVQTVTILKVFRNTKF
jgi:hypothetical protein